MSSEVVRDRHAHWEGVYRARPSNDLSWFQQNPALSVEIITALAPNRDARIIDVGGGDSLLVDHLLDLGYRRLTVLDISVSAIERARTRLGSLGEIVRWIATDVLAVEPLGTYDVWHDRALFHFLLEPKERQQYVAAVTTAVVSEGVAVIATFAPDGPQRCSGLDVCRYDEQTLAAEFADSFVLSDARREEHRTPWGSEQRFVYAVFRRVPISPG
jgi:SAM-dependent methyltransferase